MFRSLFGLDWRKSEAHLLFLTKFLRTRTAQEFANADYWRDVFGETPQQAIRRFVTDGMLTAPGLPELLAYRYKVSELRAMLKQRNLSVSGRKADLISRLIEADPGGMEKAVAGLSALHCSDRGQEVAYQYLTSVKAQRKAAEQEILALLEKGKFGEASLSVARYEAKQVFPRGLGIDWEHHDPSRDVAVLKAIFGGRPKILARLDDSRLGPLRLAAGMMHLWGTSKAEGWLPFGFETGSTMDNYTAARMLEFYALHQVDQAQHRKSGVVKSVEILVCSDGRTCGACRKLANKKYRLSEVPELPYEHCTSEMGCRCTTVAADMR